MPKKSSFRRGGRKPSKAIKRYVKRTIAGHKESKWIWAGEAAEVVTSAGVSESLCKIAQGQTSGSRDGRVVRPIAVEINIAALANVTSDQQVLRYMVVQAHRSSGTLLTADVPGFLEPVTPEQRMKYTVLMDRYVPLNADAGTEPSVVIRKVKVARGLSRITWLDGSTTATQPDQGGSICLFMVSDQISNGPSVTWTSQLTYKEL